MSYILPEVIGAGIVVFIGVSSRIVRPTKRGIIERLGKYNRFAEPGYHFVIPLFERLTRVDVTENMVEVDKQEIITKDKLNAIVDAQVYFKVLATEEGVKSAEYNVSNYYVQIVQLARTTLRNIIGTMTITEANSERGKINSELMKTLSEETRSWGIAIVRTELKDISPPSAVQEMMNQVVIAENKKQAATDFATAAETQADGSRRSAIKAAEGEKQAAILRAEGQAQAIKIVNEAANQYFVGNAQKLKQLEVTQNSLQNNSKIVLTEKGINPIIVLGESGIVPLKKGVDVI